MTLTQTVDIPLDRRLHLDLIIPQEIPVGKANIIIFPLAEHRTDSVNGQIRIKENEAPKIVPVCGCAKGQFRMADDFCEPLEDFKDYMY